MSSVPDHFLLGDFLLQATFESLDEILKRHHCNISFRQYLPVVLFIWFCICKMVLTSESLNEILKCEHSNED